MLRLSNISKTYGDKPILREISFVVNADDRLGLVGPNGSGKSTLLRIIAGQESADGGSLQFVRPGLRVGYLEQGLAYAPGATVRDVLLKSAGELRAAEAEVERLAAELADPSAPGYAEALAAYSAALAKVEALAGAETEEYRAEAVLAETGLDGVPLESEVATLSSGQRTRLGLARLLLQKPDLLLLDEPTNHLDIEAVAWLERWLAGFAGGLLVVSHDRTLLDRVATTILELDPHTLRVTAYPGNYSAYLEAKAREEEKAWAAYRAQQKRVAEVEEEVRRLTHYADNLERRSIHFHVRKIAKGLARRAVVQRRRMERELESTAVEKPGRDWQIKADFGDVPAHGGPALTLEGLVVGHGNNPLLAPVDEVLRSGERVALVGPNGSGKTTLLQTIAGLLRPLGGAVRIGPSVRLGYFSQEQRNLAPDENALQAIQRVAPMSETDARTFLHRFLFAGDEVFVPVRALSYGERARLELARLVAFGCNCLLLDEPLNHLDIPSRTQFEAALASFEGSILAVAHDRYFVQAFAERIWSLAGGRLTVCYSLEELGW